MSQDREAGVETDTGSRPQRASGAARRRPGTSWIVTVVLVALLVGAAVVAVTTYRQHRSEDASARDRREALSVAEQFTLRLDGLSYKDIDGYRKRVTALLTPKMRSDFNGSFKGFDAAFTSIQFSSKGEIKAAGVSEIDEDSATVLVIHDVTVKSKGCVQPPYKRMKVDLRKIKGAWLVDDFQEGVPGCQG